MRVDFSRLHASHPLATARVSHNPNCSRQTIDSDMKSFHSPKVMVIEPSWIIHKQPAYMCIKSSTQFFVQRFSLYALVHNSWILYYNRKLSLEILFALKTDPSPSPCMYEQGGIVEVQACYSPEGV